MPGIECRCSGGDYEMGEQQGQVLAVKVHGLRERLADLEAFRMQQPFWLPYPAFLRLAEWTAKRTLGAALQRSATGALERVRGIAAGARCPLGGVCLLNAMEAHLGSCEGHIDTAPLGACSTVAIRRSRSADGRPVVAKNFDYIPLAQPFYFLRESRPRGGYRSLDFAVAPQAGTIDGVNEHGLCITLNYAFLLDSGRPAPLITMLIAEALARCKDVAGALDYIRQRPRWGSGILMLADDGGELVSLELSSSRSAVRRPAPGEDWLAFTNVCRCSETCAAQVPESARFSERVPLPLRGRPVLEWHTTRSSRIETLVRSCGTLGTKELAAIMADHGPQGQPDGSSPCVHTEYWRTTAALQWLPSTRSVRAWYGTACTAQYVHLSL